MYVGVATLVGRCVVVATVGVGWVYVGVATVAGCVVVATVCVGCVYVLTGSGRRVVVATG